MSAKRLYYALGVVAVLAMLTLAARAAFGAVKAQQNSQIDSATRSYTAWAKAVADQRNANTDSATRSYTAWAKAIADQRNAGIDSATRSYMAWAHYIEEQHTTPMIAP
ncbi:MAG TPA: hypothetical protein VF784_08175 [Anaerolineales bacterium]